MRVFIAEENCKEDGLVTAVIPDYVSVWNLDLQEYYEQTNKYFNEN